MKTTKGGLRNKKMLEIVRILAIIFLSGLGAFGFAILWLVDKTKWKSHMYQYWMSHYHVSNTLVEKLEDYLQKTAQMTHRQRTQELQEIIEGLKKRRNNNLIEADKVNR